MMSPATYLPTARVSRCVPPPPGDRPSSPSGRPKPRAGRADDDVAAERQLEAAAERIAVHRRNSWLRQRLQLVEDAPAVELVVDEGPGAPAAIFGDVGARDEGAPARAGEDDRAHVRIAGQCIECLVQRVHERRRQRVQLGRTVEDNADDARLDAFVQKDILSSIALIPSPRRRSGRRRTGVAGGRRSRRPAARSAPSSPSARRSGCRTGR